MHGSGGVVMGSGGGAGPAELDATVRLPECSGNTERSRRFRCTFVLNYLHNSVACQGMFVTWSTQGVLCLLKLCETSVV